MRCLKSAAVAVTIAAATAGAAQATTVVNFDAGPLYSPITTYTESGYTFTYGGPGLAFIWDANSPNSNGTPNLILGFSPSDAITITKVGGGSFKLISADLAVSWFSMVSPNTVLANGSPLTIDSTLTTYNFNATGTSFTLTGLASDDGYWVGDNFTFGAVPEPANWAMLIAGFGLVGVVARRRRIAVAA
jgi:hypothetical protein